MTLEIEKNVRMMILALLTGPDAVAPYARETSTTTLQRACRLWLVPPEITSPFQRRTVFEWLSLVYERPFARIVFSAAELTTGSSFRTMTIRAFRMRGIDVLDHLALASPVGTDAFADRVVHVASREKRNPWPVAELERGDVIEIEIENTTPVSLEFNAAFLCLSPKEGA